MTIQNLKMKREFKIAAIIIALLAAGYLAIPADGWSDSRLFAFGIMFFVSGFWVAQDPRVWRLRPANAGDDNSSKS